MSPEEYYGKWSDLTAEQIEAGEAEDRRLRAEELGLIESTALTGAPRAPILGGGQTEG